MKLIIWQPKTYNLFLPIIIVFSMMLLETLPLTLPFSSYLKPFLFFIVVWYFYFHYPKLLPLWVIFILGLLYDLQTGGRVGVTGFALWVAFLLPHFVRQSFHELHMLDFLLKFAICMLLYQLVQELSVYFSTGNLPSLLVALTKFIVSLILTPFIWRLLSFLDNFLPTDERR